MLEHWAAMPRYFFDLRNDVDVNDEEGRELAGLPAVRAVAIAEAREMMTESVLNGHLDLNHSIEVRDERGIVILIVHFGEAVNVKPVH